MGDLGITGVGLQMEGEVLTGKLEAAIQVNKCLLVLITQLNLGIGQSVNF